VPDSRGSGRGQAPKPRSGASETPGLRSTTHRGTIDPQFGRPSASDTSDRSSVDLYTYFFLGRYDEAASWAATALQHNPDHQPALRIAAASNAMAGRLEQAQKAIVWLCQVYPTLRISDLKTVLGPYRRAEDPHDTRKGCGEPACPNDHWPPHRNLCASPRGWRLRPQRASGRAAATARKAVNSAAIPACSITGTNPPNRIAPWINTTGSPRGHHIRCPPPFSCTRSIRGAVIFPELVR
jgi:hypothetical protein